MRETVICFSLLINHDSRGGGGDNDVISTHTHPIHEMGK